MARNYTYNDAFEILKSIKLYRNRCLEVLENYSRIKNVVERFLQDLNARTPLLAFNNASEAEQLKSVQDILNFRKKIVFATGHLIMWAKKDVASEESKKVYKEMTNLAKEYLYVDFFYPIEGTRYNPDKMVIDIEDDSIKNPIVSDQAIPGAYDNLDNNSVLIPAIVSVKDDYKKTATNDFLSNLKRY